MDQRQDDRFVAGLMTGKDRWSVVAICAGMTAVCIALVAWGGTVGLIGGLPGVVFFGLICLPYIVLRAARPRPALIADASGLTLNRHALDLGFVSWDEVERIETTSLAGRPWVVVQLRDSAAFLRRHRPVRRALLRLNGKPALRTLRIPGSSLPIAVSDVAAIMEAKRNASDG